MAHIVIITNTYHSNLNIFCCHFTQVTIPPTITAITIPTNNNKADRKVDSIHHPITEIKTNTNPFLRCPHPFRSLNQPSKSGIS